MLKDLSALLDRDDEADEAELKQTAQRLLAWQFVIRSRRGHRAHYDRVLRHLRYYTELMDALNYRLHANEQAGFVGIIPNDFVSSMKLEETLILLALRYIYDEQVQAFQVEDDRSVLISLPEFQRRYQHITKRGLPASPVVFRDYLKQFESHGLIDQVSDAEHALIRILPTLADLLNAQTLQTLAAHIKLQEASPETLDGEACE